MTRIHVLELAERVRTILHRGDVSLDAPADPTSESSAALGEVLEDPRPGPAEEYAAADRAERLRAHLRTLTPREQEVLRHRFGLDGADVLTLEGVGELLGLSRERIRQVERDALSKLRKQMRPIPATPQDPPESPGTAGAFQWPTARRPPLRRESGPRGRETIVRWFGTTKLVEYE